MSVGNEQFDLFANEKRTSACAIAFKHFDLFINYTIIPYTKLKYLTSELKIQEVVWVYIYVLLRYMDSDYPFVIFKLFFTNCTCTTFVSPVGKA